MTVKVVNLEEPGVVTLSTRQPRDGIELTATHTDPDGRSDTDPSTDLTAVPTTWQWARSPNGTERDGPTIEVDTEDDDQVGKTATFTHLGRMTWATSCA